MTPGDLGRSTGIEPKRIRQYLRDRWPHEKNTRWELTDVMVTDVCRHFGLRPPGERSVDLPAATPALRPRVSASTAPLTPPSDRSPLASIGFTPAGSYQWAQDVQLDRPGVYVITTDRTYGAEEVPLSNERIDELLQVRPELRVDGRRPTNDQLRERVERMWVPDSTIVYIGLASTSVRSRVNQYYRTALGARAPHAGGWPLKLLSVLDRCTVHVAEASDPEATERRLVRAFQGTFNAPPLYIDPGCLVPYANLTVPGGVHKRHGITDARAPR